MKLNISVLLLIFCVAACAVTSKAKTSPEILARAAVSADPNEAAAAIAELRETGPDGLSILLRIHSDEINRQITTPAVTPEWQRLSSALDAVSQQKDSYLSGLYWYTDLNQAEAAARASGKPILSLRLLGS